jgi:small neutral amino acid transporter SnatA (MarC family)
MLMASRDPEQMGAWFAALSAAMLVTTIVLLASHRLQAVLGERAIIALERLMGLVLTALAVEMLLGGMRTFMESLSR